MVVENSVRNSGIANDLRAVSFVDPNTAVAVGAAGAILRTDDGGKTWFKLQSGTTDGLTAVTFFDAHRGIASGGHFVFPFHYYGITLLTADSGATWTGVQEGAWFRGLSFVSPEIGTGVGYTGGEVSSSIIRRTTDGGLSWREQSGFRFAPSSEYLWWTPIPVQSSDSMEPFCGRGTEASLGLVRLAGLPTVCRACLFWTAIQASRWARTESSCARMTAVKPGPWRTADFLRSRQSRSSMQADRALLAGIEVGHIAFASQWVANGGTHREVQGNGEIIGAAL